MKSMQRTAVTLLLVAGASFSQDSTATWKISGVASFMTTVNTYSESWTGGEQGTATWTAGLNATAEKQLRPALSNRNTLRLAFGQSSNQDQATKEWADFEKSTDLIDLESLWKLTLGWFVDPYLSGHLISQFVDERDTTFTRYANPIDLTESSGGSRDLLKTDRIVWSTRLGAAVRQLVDREVAYSGGRHTEMTNDGGVEWVNDLKWENEAKWAKWASTLKVYEALVSSKASETDGTAAEGHWRRPDVNFENTLSLNITRYVMINLYAQLLYDREISDEARFKETLAVGLTYAFDH